MEKIEKKVKFIYNIGYVQDTLVLVANGQNEKLSNGAYESARRRRYFYNANFPIGMG